MSAELSSYGNQLKARVASDAAPWESSIIRLLWDYYGILDIVFNIRMKVCQIIVRSEF